MDVNKEELSVVTEDEYKLAVSQFIPAENDCKAVIVIASATAVRRQYYFNFSSFMAARGYRVICFDYRGIGDSLHEDIRKLDARARDWGEYDLAAMIRWTKSNYPDDKLHMVCHSIGGHMLGLASNNHLVDSVLHCSVQSGYWKYWTGFERYKLALLWYFLVPVLTKLLKYFPSKNLGVGENMPVGIISEWASWCRDPAYIFGKNQPASIGNLKNIQAPIRSYSFGGDNLAPVTAVDFMSEKYPNDIERIHIDAHELSQKGVGHFDIFRSKMQNTLWIQFLKWFDKHN